MKRKVRYILARIVGVLAIILLAACFLLQLPAVQTALAKRAASLLDDVCDAEVGMSSVKIYLPGTLVIKDLLIVDKAPLVDTDTLLYAETLSATLKLGWLLRGEGIHLSRVTLENGVLTVVPENTGHLVNINRILRRIPPEFPPEVKDGHVFDLSRVDVKNLHLRLINRRDSTRRVPPYGIDFGNLELYTNIRGHDLHFTDGLMYGTSDHCDIHVVGCDYNVHNVTGNCRVGKGMTLVENIRIVDDWSDFRVKMFSMEYRSPRYIRFLKKKVKLDIVPEGGNLSMQTLKQFTGKFDGNLTDIELNRGRIDGYLFDLGIHKLDIRDRYSGITGMIDGRLMNMNNPEKFGLSLRLINLTATTSDIEKCLSQWAKDSKADLKKFAPGQKLVLNASANGKINNLETELSLKSPSGSISADASVRNVADKDLPILVDGRISTRKLALDRIVPDLPVSNLNMTGWFDASLERPGLNFRIDSLNISTVKLLKGDFHDIDIKAGMTGDDAFLKLASHDPSLDLSLFGCADVGDERSLKLAGAIRNISLDAFGLTGRSKVHSISTVIDADIEEDDRGRINGDVNIPNVVMRTDSSVINSGKINLKARFGRNYQKIDAKSELVDINFTGNKPVKDFAADLVDISVRKYLPALLKQGRQNGKADEEGKKCGAFDLAVNFHRSPELLDLAIPGAYISDSTKMQVKVTQEGILRGAIASSRIEVGNLTAKKVDVSFDNAENMLNAFVTGREIELGRMKFQKTRLSLFARDNCIDAGVSYDNSAAGKTELANLKISGALWRNELDSLNIAVKPYMSYFKFDDRIWKLNGEASLYNGNLKFRNVTLSGRDEKIRIDGGWAKSGRDTVNIEVNDFGIGFFDRLLGFKLDADGLLSGHATIESPLGPEAEINADLKCANVNLGAVELGDLAFDGGWDRATGKIVMTLQNTLYGQESVSAHVEYMPSNKKISAHARLNRLNLAVAKPIMKNVFSDMGGYLDGEFTASGRPGALTITEDGARFEDAMITVAMTGVTYYLNGDLDLDNRSLSFNDLEVKDNGVGKGRLSGRVTFGKPLKVNAGLEMDRLRVLNTPEKTSLPVYGQVETSGKIGISGVPGNFNITADILADSPGDVHIPLNTALVSSTSDLLTFVEMVKYGEGKPDQTAQSKKKQKKTAVKASGRLRIGRYLTAWAEIDKTAGNKMKVNGDGDVTFDINSASGVMKLNGNYSIDDGYYHFVVPGLLEKDFNIGKGSSVTLSGGLKDISLDINATHPVRASLATLLADTTVTSNRTNVDCIIDINGMVSSPKLAFDIDIPDIDPTTRAKVETALNTEDKKQKQFMSLLLLGTFLPAEESGVINGTNMLYSNVGEIMSGQVNSIMQKLEIPVDFGFGYQQSIKGDNMYDVAVSTQLFNNRVLINGSVGSRSKTGGSAQGSVVGDIDISVKLDRIGKWRVNVFSRSADEYTSFIDNSQRSGLGISYQKEFSTLKELFSTGRKAAAEVPKEDNKIIIKVE